MYYTATTTTQNTDPCLVTVTTFNILHDMFLCCKYRLEDTGCEEKGVKFSLRSLVFMFAWTKGFSKHWEREIAFPLKIREVSICLSNLSCYAVKPLRLSVERNGKWKVCILGCAIPVSTCCYRSTGMTISPVVNPALLFKRQLRSEFSGAYLEYLKYWNCYHTAL